MSFINLSQKYKKLSTYILLFAFSNFFSIGCYYKYQKGDLIRTEKIPNSEKLINKNYEFKIISMPTLKDPEIRISISEIPEFQEIYKTIYNKDKLQRRNSFFYNFGTGFGGTIAGIGIGMYIYSFFEKRKESGGNIDKSAVLTIGAVGIALFSLSFINQKWDKIASVGQIDGEMITKNKINKSLSKNVKFVTLKVIYKNNRYKYYKGNNLGEVKINLVRDFDLRIFKQPEDVELNILSEEFNINKSITLNPKDWTEQYVQIKNNRAPLKNSPKGTSRTLSFLDVGTEYEVKTEFKKYYSIEHKGVRGYVAKANTNSFWSVPERLDPKNPPNLIVKHVEFSDPSNDQFLDAEESGTIKVYLKNIGRGNAYRVGLKINSNEKNTSQLSYPAYVNVGAIKPGESKTVEVPVKASTHTKDGKTTFQLNVREANGFDAQPVNLTLQKRAFRPPLLEMADYGIDDANKNGRIELGEYFNVTVRIRNKGTGTAKNVAVKVNLDKSAQNVFYDGYTNSFNVNILKPGESKDVKFPIYTNNRYDRSTIPIIITLTESKGKYGSSIPLNLPLDRPVKQSRQFLITGKDDDTPAFNPINDLTPDVDMNIPVTKNKNPNAVAVIIGLSKYQNRNIPQVDYAKRDAAIIKEYLLKTFGYDKKKIIELYDYNATLASFRRVFEEQLPNFIQGNDVFIYYSGHGVPDLKTEEAYFAPYDFNPSYTKSTGYKLNDFYKSLRSLNARSITVVIDACFSGTSYGGQIYEGISPINIRVKNPQMLLNNGLVLTSSKGNQVSTWYREKKHGLFTYYFLKGLQGAADKNHDKKITAAEMKTYLQKNVSETAGFQNRTQMPQVFGDLNSVLLSY